MEAVDKMWAKKEAFDQEKRRQKRRGSSFHSS
jgi:hypothetical protein